jgi:hypothetical protein
VALEVNRKPRTAQTEWREHLLAMFYCLLAQTRRQIESVEQQEVQADPEELRLRGRAEREAVGFMAEQWEVPQVLLD